MIIVILLLLGVGLLIGILASVGVFNTSTNPVTSISHVKQSPYISPEPFGTGYITNHLPPKQRLADNCNSTIYPIQPPYVNYGTSNVKNCDVNIFNSPP